MFLYLILGCGISLAKQTAQRRIVGGDDAGFGSFPWQAYIRIGSSRYVAFNYTFNLSIFQFLIALFLKTGLK